MLGSLLVVTGVIVLSYIWWKNLRPRNFPPGPQGIPFLGNLPSLGATPAVKLLEWKCKYGDVFGWYNGRQPVVVLSDFNTIRRVLGEDSASGRINKRAFRNNHTSIPIGIGLLWSEGELWRTHRRFALSTLRSLGMGRNWMEDSIIMEVEGFCQALRETNRKPFDPKVHLTNSVSNVICALIFGKRFELTDPKFSKLTSLIADNLSLVRMEFLVRVLPFLMWFPNQVRGQIFKARQNETLIAEFMKARVREQDGIGGKQAVGYVSAYRKEQELQRTDGVENPLFTEIQLVGSLYDLFTAGTESTATTVRWTMVFMIENPEIMLKVQREIDETVGEKSVLTTAVRASLPYTEAVILEVQRCANVFPLSVPHRTRDDVQIDGYTIPKDTLILPNLASIHRDERWWKNPETFNPSRFLDEDGKLTRPNDAFAPFGIGKRACLGESLARTELFLFVANLLRCFTLELPEGKTLSHKDYHSSIVDSPLPFELIFLPRF